MSKPKSTWTSNTRRSIGYVTPGFRYQHIWGTDADVSETSVILVVLPPRFSVFLDVVRILLVRFWLQTTYSICLSPRCQIRRRFPPNQVAISKLHLYSEERHLLMDFWLAALVNAYFFPFTVLHLIRISTSACVFEELFKRHALGRRTDIILHLNWIFCLSNWANPTSLFPLKLGTEAPTQFIWRFVYVLLFYHAERNNSLSLFEMAVVHPQCRRWWSCQSSCTHSSPVMSLL